MLEILGVNSTCLSLGQRRTTGGKKSLTFISKQTMSNSTSFLIKISLSSLK